MRAISHYVFTLVGLIILGFLVGWSQALWVAVALVISIGLNSMTFVVSTADKYGSNPWTSRLISIFTFGSILVAIGAAILLFIRLGWAATLGYIFLFIGYFAIREDSSAKWERSVAQIRETLRENIAQRLAGKLTPEQVEQRCLLLLEDLPKEAYYLDFLYESLLAKEGMTSSEYHAYLQLLEQYLSKIERLSVRFSELHKKVRAALALPDIFGYSDHQNK